MKTKRIFLAVMTAALLSCPVLNAQNGADGKQTRENKQEQMLNLRVQRMQKRLSLDDKKGAEFAPLYKEYLEEIAACYTSTRSTIEGKQITDEERTERIENSFERRQRVLDTEQEYYNKFKEILNSRQLEAIFRTPNAQPTGQRMTADCKHKGNKSACKGKNQNCKAHKQNCKAHKQHCKA